jgi:predicted N-acetyltransferase YhbS
MAVSAAAAVPGEAVRLEPAGPGDHAAIYQLYTAVFQGPSRDAFFASLDDPFYEPRHRLLIRQGTRIVSHVHLTERALHFAGQQFPVAGLSSLGTMPEYCGRGYGRTLLRAADAAMAEGGAVLGLLSTKIPHFFRSHGWAVCGRHSFARTRTRDLLAQLSAIGIPPAETTLNIRPWRQVELPSLMQLYAAGTAGSTGAFVRTEAYWRWLASRQGFDQIYVAIDGPDKLDFGESASPIVGYVVTKEDRILELMASDARPRIAEQLLARAASEAMERDIYSVQYHAPPGDRFFSLFRDSGAVVHHHEADQGEVFMVKLLNPIGFPHLIGAELCRRAQAGGLGSRAQLGFHLEGEKYRLVVGRGGAKLIRGKPGRSYIRCNLAEYTRLVLGHIDVDHAIAQDRLLASTRLAQETASILFPRLPLWRSPWDELFI